MPNIKICKIDYTNTQVKDMEELIKTIEKAGYVLVKGSSKESPNYFIVTKREGRDDGRKKKM